jgi:FMN reductase
VLDGIGARIGGQGRLIELADRGASFFDALSRDAMNERARAIVEAIEDADILVVGTPCTAPPTPACSSTCSTSSTTKR